MSDLFADLDDVDWPHVSDAYGPADEMGVRLRMLLSEDADDRKDALWELWGTAWHQGTVYAASPMVVPFLVAVATSPVADPRTRGDVALLLTDLATADTFVLPGEVATRRTGDTGVGRDLADETARAVRVAAETLGHAYPGAPEPTRTGLVAVLAAVAGDVPTATGLVLRADAADAAEAGARVAAALRLTADLVVGRPVTEQSVRTAAAVDPDVADLLDTLRDRPLGDRAVDVVRELCTAHLTELEDRLVARGGDPRDPPGPGVP